ncbi:DUF2142 domain-containing protein [Paenibacillus bovis]|uniref:DUF2142 domain-containing protein n=1 Tax=Paenibacillus bovis TaxID=1616788 RepID=A0A172ZLH2_9BACL|nr:hypothetical protein AR543_22245 [Paenibacillus bovis]
MEREQARTFNIEKKLLSILLLFGLLCVFITPPFQMADEDSHFKRAYTVAMVDLIPQANQQGELGFYLPKAIVDFEASYRYMKADTKQKFNYQQYYTAISTPTDYSEKVFSEFSTVETNPLLYVPQAAAMIFFKVFMYIFSLGKAELLTPVSYMYAGRIGNLLFFIFCSYMALKLIPFYKRVVFLIACMPMTLGLVSSTSYDGMVIGICLLFIGLVFHLAFNPEAKSLERKHVIVLCILSFVLIQLKQVYFPLILLFALIPKAKFLNMKTRITQFVLILLSGLVSYGIWSFLSQIHGKFDTNGNSSGQLAFIISHPIEYVEILIRTFYELSFFYTNSFVGNLGWLDTNFPPIFIYMYCLLILVFAILDSNRNITITVKHKLITLATFVISVVLIETGLYLTWTSIPEIGGVGYPTVSGVQGRYFIPVVILLLTVLYNHKLPRYLKAKQEDFSDNVLITFCTFSSVLMLFFIIVRYWIPVV